MPQQFGVWQVAGLGIVVAFRGTASQEDVIIDANISPVPLDAARATRGMWSCLTASTLQDKAPCIEELLLYLVEAPGMLGVLRRMHPLLHLYHSYVLWSSSHSAFAGFSDFQGFK